MPLFPPGSRVANIFGISVTNTGFVEVIGPAEKRVGIVFGANPSTNIQYTTNKNAPGHQAINIVIGSPPLYLGYEQIGELVKQAWYAQGDVVGPNGTIIIEILDNT